MITLLAIAVLVVGYPVGRNEAPQALAGETTLSAVRLGSSGTADVLSMELREPRVFRPGGCALASYSGTFVGVIGPPIETGTIAAVNAGPNPTPPRWSDAPAA